MNFENQSESPEEHDIQNNDIQQLSGLLRSIADEIDNNQLDNAQLEYIQRFCLAYRASQLINDNDAEDLIKFLILGWYVYTLASATETRYQHEL